MHLSVLYIENPSAVGARWNLNPHIIERLKNARRTQNKIEDEHMKCR
jgi:hypothetical protein